MTDESSSKAKVINERWIGKYDMICDVVLGGRAILGVAAEAPPLVRDAEVFFPMEASTLNEEERSKIVTAALARYYDIDLD
jgi:hypothetical protein